MASLGAPVSGARARQLRLAPGPSRRRVTLANLTRVSPNSTSLRAGNWDAACSATWPVPRSTIPCSGRAVARTSSVWCGSRAWTGAWPDQRPLVMLAPHFVGLDAGAVRLSIEMRAVSIYARQSNPVWDGGCVRTLALHAAAADRAPRLGPARRRARDARRPALLLPARYRRGASNSILFHSWVCRLRRCRWCRVWPG